MLLHHYINILASSGSSVGGPGEHPSFPLDFPMQVVLGRNTQ
jgi:hypothetical protein